MKANNKVYNEGMKRKLLKTSLPFPVDKTQNPEDLSYKVFSLDEMTPQMKKEILSKEMERFAYKKDFLKRAREGKINKVGK